MKLGVWRVVGAIGVIESLAGLAGCGDLEVDDVGGISGATARAFSGVYVLTHLTENSAGCDAEGRSLLGAAQDRLFVLASRIVLGNLVIVIASCSGVEDCVTKGQAIRNNDFYFTEYSYTLSSEIDPTRLAGFEVSSGFGNGDGMCIGRAYSDYSLTLSEGAVRLESRTKLLADRPHQDGACLVTPEATSEAATLLCSELTVLEGTKA